MKICTKCKETKSLSDFYRKFANTDVLRAECKECQKAGVRASYARNKEARQKKQREYKYGLYNKLAHCEACGALEDLNIDHDHSCCDKRVTCGNCVRGTLCGTCNRAAGLLGDSVERLYLLAKYLEERT